MTDIALTFCQLRLKATIGDVGRTHRLSGVWAVGGLSHSSEPQVL